MFKMPWQMTCRLVLSSLTLPLVAQSPLVEFERLYTFDGSSEGNGLGVSVAAAGDVNGDGFADVLAAAHKADPSGRRDAGSAYVYSGRDGAILWRFDGARSGDLLGMSVAAAGDVNKDGFGDVVVGVRKADPRGQDRAGAAMVYSGRDGSTLWRFDGADAFDQLGFAVAGVGDVNLDGHSDVVATAVGAGMNGLAYLYSGKNGAVLWQVENTSPEGSYGWSVAGAGDVNGDGVPDVVLGAPALSESRTGFAYVYSGKDGAILLQFRGFRKGDTLGWSVDGVGDMNNDGYADVIIGAPAWSAGRPGWASVFSGRDGSEIWKFSGSTVDDAFGHSVSAAGDVNGDGFPDVIMGAPFSRSHASEEGYVVIHSGRDGASLWRITGDAATMYGLSVAGAGDVNGDLSPDVVVAARYADPGDNEDAGSVFVYASSSPLNQYGFAVEGSGRITPRIGTGGEIPRIGSATFRIEVTGAVGGVPCMIIGSFASAEMTLHGLTLYGDFLTAGTFLTWRFLSSGTPRSPGAGVVTLPVRIPADPTLLGFTSYWQAFVSDFGSPLPIAVSQTRGLAVTVIR